MTTSPERRLLWTPVGANRRTMSKSILSYPDGIAGAALFLLRVSSGLASWPVFTRLSETPDHWWVGIATTLAVASLVLGLFTRLTAVLVVTAIAAGSLLDAEGGALLLLLSSAAGTAALALMGPGAFSVDSQRDGRRVIKLMPHSPDGGRKD